MEQPGIGTLKEIEEFESVPIEERLKFSNTYDLIKNGVSLNPEALALSFILSGEHYNEPMEVSYRDLMTNVNRAANLFHDVGVGPGDVISYLLPNLPQTHYIFWGGEAAGIINPINPLLEPSAIRDICQAVGTKVMVSLGEYPGSDIWEKVIAIRKDLPNLKSIIRVIGPSDEKDGILGFDEVI
ncbi:MAG: AMP-binding protein, partial [Deltaproteobacteria bacterium]|nr:AMP-binding protein [Deltaproteobacteria bacterium]